MKKIKINLIVLIICIILTITSITLFILKNYLVSTYDDNQNDLWKIFMNIENLNYENYIKNEYGSISEFRKKFPIKTLLLYIVNLKIMFLMILLTKIYSPDSIE
ncbi:hypothetical protein NW072_04800 [Mycoplasmopsis felis]|uniref:hypothetical protein n=1 Tax=Mycoplasmopsis felis TaxID=33923 RepID=UPI0021AF8DA8|nr:hypothetical protein [Mycoplasmopsis felis]UWV79347.1 hypothetical protein NW072_04800 [Mycoplasmopsis felis]